jgi:hypothetical protein
VVCDGPSDHAFGIAVDHGGQVDECLPPMDVGDVLRRPPEYADDSVMAQVIDTAEVRKVGIVTGM